MAVKPENYIPSKYVPMERTVKKCGSCGRRIRNKGHDDGAEHKSGPKQDKE